MLALGEKDKEFILKLFTCQENRVSSNSHQNVKPCRNAAEMILWEADP